MLNSASQFGHVKTLICRIPMIPPLSFSANGARRATVSCQPDVGKGTSVRQQSVVQGRLRHERQFEIFRPCRNIAHRSQKSSNSPMA